VTEKAIFLVEDNPDDLELTLHAFEANNITNPIVTARDGMEALDYLFARGAHAARESRPLPALTLLDLQLPRIGGIEVLRQVRANERTKFLPVVVLTSSREDQDLLRCYGLGVNSYVRKPVDYGQFTDMIRRLGQYWLEINEAPPPGLRGRP
jgi:two-component system, response regulator